MMIGMSLSHSRRNFLRLFLPLALLVVMGMFFYGRANIERDLVRARSQEALSVGLGAGQLSGTLEAVTRDLTFLARHSALRTAVDAPTAQNLQYLAQDFATFSQSKGVYDQLRWIDETGMEIVRVDLVKGQAIVVASDQLQDKRTRYFFTDTVQLDPGQLFVSPLDLNIEHDQIEVPHKPMLRVATPIVDSRGHRRGIVIVNFLGRVMLESFSKATSAIADHVMVADGQGYWLKSPHPGDEWGFMFKRPDLSLAARFPEAWARIRAAESGQEVLADGLWTWQPVHPLLVGQHSSMGAATATVPTQRGAGAKAYVWIAVAHLPRATWLALQLAVWRQLSVITLALLGLLGFGSWKLARAWTKLASAEEDVRRLNADLEQQVEARTRELRHKVTELDGEIAERRRVEDTLRKISIAVEQSPASVVITDTQGAIDYVNPKFTELTGYTLAEVRGKNPRILKSGVSPPHHFVELWSTITAGEVWRGDFCNKKKNGEIFWEHTSISPIKDVHGGITGFLAVKEDITERKKSGERERLLEVQLRHAQKMESLGSLAGGVAHDMNNVLGAILGLASANLEAQPDDSPARRAFDTIAKAALRGGKMVKSLLNFARQTPAEELELDLNGIVLEEVRLLERTTLSKVRLELDLASDLKPIRGDASALTHAFMNLCVNAVDAMPENGTLTLRTRNVDSDWIEVQVGDTGTGMPKEVLEKAMDPFFTTKECGKGTGLGLSMVYSTVKTHQGRMEIQSEPGRGTCVRMRFPVCEVPPPAAEPAAGTRSKPSPRPLTVLLVDDDDLVRSSILAILGMLGHTATSAADGEEALAKLEAGFQPDVVILDMNMPGLGGSGTLPRLRVLRPTVPILLATGRADQTAMNLIEAHPFVTLLAKPFDMKDLKKYLESVGQG